MTDMKNTILLVIVAYLIGTVNPSYIIGKLKGVDIREKGSGNAGGSNALINFGKVIGILCIIFDIAKAYFTVYLAQKTIGTPIAVAAVGSAVILGHIFPFYMKFRGGKGFACLGGFVLSFNPLVFLIMLVYAVVVVLATDFICFAPITCSVIFSVVYGVMTKSIIGGGIVAISAIAILFRHRENIRRIKNKTELHFSYLWNKDEEIERVANK